MALGLLPEALSCYVGVYSAWLYLRFFCPNDDGTIGDLSDTFALSTCFPQQTRPFLAPFCSVAASCGRCMGCSHTTGGGRAAGARAQRSLGGLDDSSTAVADHTQ